MLSVEQAFVKAYACNIFLLHVPLLLKQFMKGHVLVQCCFFVNCSTLLQASIRFNKTLGLHLVHKVNVFFFFFFFFFFFAKLRGFDS